MPKPFLKISSLILCGLLIYNSLGYFLVLSITRLTIQQQKWAHIHTLPEHELTTFIFSKHNTNARIKIVNSHEIQVDGKLYDVVRKDDNGVTCTYKCVYDKKEESLIAKTRQLNSMTQSMPVKSTNKAIIEKIIKTATVTYKKELFNKEVDFILSIFKAKSYSVPSIFILSPPPQV